jgi:hypothetical protein
MHLLLLIGILAFAFSCAISLTVPTSNDYAAPSSLSERLLPNDQDSERSPLG